MSGSVITSTNVVNAIMKMVASQALEALVGNLVMGSLVNRNYEASFQQSGDTISVPIPSPLTANKISETGTIALQNPSLGSAQIVLNNHVESSFSLPNVVQALATPDVAQIYMREAIIAIAEQIETDLLNTYPLFTYNSALGSSTALTEATLDSAETALFNAKVPASQPRYFVCSGSAYSSLRQISAFRDWSSIGPNVSVGTAPAMTGQLAGAAMGEIKGFKVFRSQYVPKVSTTVYNMAFAPDALGLVIRKLAPPPPGTGAIAEYAEMGNFGVRVVMSFNPQSLAQTFTVDTLYGISPFRQNFAQVVESN